MKSSALSIHRKGAKTVPKCAAGAALGIAGMGNYIGAGIQSVVSGYLIRRADDGSAVLLGHVFDGGYSLDWLAVFWVGVAALSVLCVLAAGKGAPCHKS